MLRVESRVGCPLLELNEHWAFLLCRWDALLQFDSVNFHLSWITPPPPTHPNSLFGFHFLSVEGRIGHLLLFMLRYEATPSVAGVVPGSEAVQRLLSFIFIFI